MRTLMVVSAAGREATQAAVAADRSPRKDYLELAAELDAEILDYDAVAVDRRLRSAAKALGMPAAQALAAFSRRAAYDCLYTDGEHVGLPLALLLRGRRRRPRHVTVGHLLDTGMKRVAIGLLGQHPALDAVLVHSSLQQARASARLRLSPERIHLIPYQVDTRFWRTARPPDDEPLVCSAGLEYRDYPTLLAAVTPLRLRAVIAAASHWSRHRDATQGRHLPANVAVTSLDYVGLRDLYARARAVVVPLRPVANQAGVTTILEAMSMGKPVIVTATPGQRDVVRGRLVTADGPGTAMIGGPRAFGVDGPLSEVETGLYVPPGDSAALRSAIQYLLDRPDEADGLGAAGRRVAEAVMSIERFVDRVSGVVRACAPAGPLPRGAIAADRHSGRSGGELG